MHGRQIALAVVIVLLTPLAALGGGPGRSWQDGELLSRKTVPIGRTFLRNAYVYRVRGLNQEYLVMSETPLELDLYVPMKFSRDHRQILIQDAGGNERKVQILRRAAVSLRQ
jgi:hypothetical protein